MYARIESALSYCDFGDADFGDALVPYSRSIQRFALPVWKPRGTSPLQRTGAHHRQPFTQLTQVLECVKVKTVGTETPPNQGSYAAS
jgi:hypothetical protein